MAVATKPYGVHSEVGKLRKVMVCRPGWPTCGSRRTTAMTCSSTTSSGSSEAKNEHYAFCAADARARHRRARDARRCWPRRWRSPRPAPGCSTARSTPIRWRRSAWTSCAPGWTRCRPTELAERLIGGITTSEVPSTPTHALRRHIDPIRFVVPPLPNTLFTRDTSCWIYGGVSLNPMYWPARRQETLLDDGHLQVPPHVQGRRVRRLVRRCRRRPRARRPWRAAT